MYNKHARIKYRSAVVSGAEHLIYFNNAKIFTNLIIEKRKIF